MDFDLDDEQRLILESVEQLLAEHAGPARAIELTRGGDYDFALDEALRESGFDQLAAAPDPRPLEAALVAAAVSRAGGVSAYATTAFVIPGATAGEFPLGSEVVALVDRAYPGPVRFAPQARVAVVLDGDSVDCFELEPGSVTRVRSNYGYPLGTLSLEGARRRESLGVSASRLRSWWRLGLAVEAVGAMEGALDQAVGYLKERRQFGRTIASFQGVQHRLAECAIALEGSRWLANEAAYHGAPEESAAVAASFALQAAEQIFAETHQLSGAIGFTHEHDLHVWSMRLQALRLELGGIGAQTREISRVRWGMAP